jgi:hypothetical protein
MKDIKAARSRSYREYPILLAPRTRGEGWGGVKNL